ncbi:MAG: helix-turn-helix domain-containing protein [bacterium]|nr:helix-turn-helix domain-containing protein [bacterium]
MEKLCIVNLRKKMVNPVPRDKEGGEGGPEQEYGRPSPWASPHREKRLVNDRDAQGNGHGGKKEVKAENVSLMLTQEQMDALQADPYLISFLRREFICSPDGVGYRGEPIIIKLLWEPQDTVRLLKPEDVILMLRISRSCLTEIVRKGELKSYKIGRLRRFRLDDILSYLEANQDYPAQEPHDIGFNAALGNVQF